MNRNSVRLLCDLIQKLEKFKLPAFLSQYFNNIDKHADFKATVHREGQAGSPKRSVKTPGKMTGKTLVKTPVKSSPIGSPISSPKTEG